MIVLNGQEMFIATPKDLIVVSKRSLKDHIEYLLSTFAFKSALLKSMDDPILVEMCNKSVTLYMQELWIAKNAEEISSLCQVYGWSNWGSLLVEQGYANVCLIQNAFNCRLLECT